MIIAGLGNFGVGKTHCLGRKIAQLPHKSAVFYLIPKNDKFTLYATFLPREYPAI